MAPRRSSKPSSPKASPGKKTRQSPSRLQELSDTLPAGDDWKSALKQPSTPSGESSPKYVRFNEAEHGEGNLLTPPPTPTKNGDEPSPRRISSRQRMQTASAQATLPSPPSSPTQTSNSPPKRTSARQTTKKASAASSSKTGPLNSPKIASATNTKDSTNVSNNRQSTKGPSTETLLKSRPLPSTTTPDGTRVVVPDSVIDALAKQLEITPRALSLESIHLIFYWLQKSVRRWTKAYFRYELNQAEIAAFPLAELPTQHPEFLRVTQYIADGSQYTWRNFLTSKNTRHHLVYAIVSEWFKHHIFGATCFGLSDDEIDKLSQIDILYLNWDGFVRTKERAKLLASILQVKPLEDRESDLKLSVDALVSDLMVVLEPVLPKCSQGQAKLITELDRLTRMAVALHQCIRLSGSDGTVISFRSSKKGDVFVPSARQNCVNKDFVRATECHAPNREDKIVIKAACFPLVSAVVPHGPDLKDYVDTQIAYNPHWQETDPIEPEVINAVHAKHWHDIPEDLQEDPRRVAVDPRVPVKDPKRGSYVKLYNLNVADVYCEWTPLGERATLAPEYKLTLQQAIQQAWAEKHAADSLLTKWFARAPLVVKLGASGTVLAALSAAAIKYRHSDVDLAEWVRANVRIPNSVAGSELLHAVKAHLAQAQARLRPVALDLKGAREQITNAAKLARQRARFATQCLFGGLASSSAAATSSAKQVPDVLRPLTATARVHKQNISRRA